MKTAVIFVTESHYSEQTPLAVMAAKALDSKGRKVSLFVEGILKNDEEKATSARGFRIYLADSVA